MFKTEIIKQRILNGNLNKIFKEMYGETSDSSSRYLKILKGFSEHFGCDREAALFSAPGRTEIIGNHTDHQRGMAIAASVNLDIVGVVSFNPDRVIRVKSEGFDGKDEVNLDELDVKEDEFGTSKALIRGCAAKFTELGYKISGFDMYTSSNVLKGSGLSSSAAFEVLVATVMNVLFCNGKEDALSIAKIGKYSENVYFNKPCGMLDQTASSVGGFVYMDLKNKVNPQVEKTELDLNNYGYSLCVVDTGGNHANLTFEYAGISEDLKNICEIFGKEVLTEINEEEFNQKLPKLRDKVSDRAILRAIHIFNENKRVQSFREELNNKNINKLLELVKQSGDSSFKYLQNVFSNSDNGSQGITLALCISERILGAKGAFRVHGGGFAGTIQAYVPNDLVDFYKEETEKVFGKGKCYKLSIRPYGGIRII